MRVSTGMLQEASLNHIQRVWGRIQRLQSNISTGRRLQRPSDDPIASDHVMRARSELRTIEQYKRNLDEARQFTTATESNLMRLVDLGDSLHVIAMQAADESFGSTALAALATMLDSLLEEAIELANAKYSGIRLFGGYQTRAEPFVAVRNEEGKITAVQLAGSGHDGQLQRLVAENVLLTINLTGTDLFGGDLEFFSHAIALRDSAIAGDHGTASELISLIDEDQDRINLALALTGGLITRIDGLEGWLDHQSLELEATRSEHEDLDMARAMMDFQNEQAILEAALSTTVHLMDFSLVNWMR